MRKIIFFGCIFLFIASHCYALDPVGTYSYAEKGFSGKMVVTEKTAFPLSWNILVRTVSDDQYFCEVAATGHNMISSSNSIEAIFASDTAEGTPVSQFTVKFEPKKAQVQVQETGGKCGMKGMFGGKWRKDPASTKQKTVANSKKAVRDNFTGEYHKKNGFVSVQLLSDKHLKFRINTVVDDHPCNIGENGGAVAAFYLKDRAGFTPESKEDLCVIVLQFDKNKLLVTTKSCDDYCGARAAGSMDGVYKKKSSKPGF